MKTQWICSLGLLVTVGCGTDTTSSSTQIASPFDSDAAGRSGTHQSSDCGSGSGSDDGSGFPVDRIEDIVGAEGTVHEDVLEIEIERKDIGDVQGPRGVTLTPSFEVHGSLYFQDLGSGQALLNGDLAVTEAETQPFIAALLTHGLVFQAFHQHMPTDPQLWFIHFRGVGDPIALATDTRAAINVTSTPLPQMKPAHPTTPLDADRLASILHGDAEVGDEGVVTVTVKRTTPVTVDGVRVSPEAGISTSIEFKPTSGQNADVVPDFSMTSGEVNPVVRRMLVDLGWYQGCLYNQETAETPQLYFDHMVKSGDAYELAAEVRSGLNLTDL